MMKVLGISASPRPSGNSERLLDIALEQARQNKSDVKKIIVNLLNIKPCQECPPDISCWSTGECIYNDDMQQIYNDVEGADIIIISAPVFFGSVPAQLKAMIDRFQRDWARRFVLKMPLTGKNKIGAFICVQATAKEKDFCVESEKVIKNLFAVLDVKYKEKLFCYSLEGKDDVLKRQDCLDAAKKLGIKLLT